jgi:hypothetical protein
VLDLELVVRPRETSVKPAALARLRVFMS